MAPRLLLLTSPKWRCLLARDKHRLLHIHDNVPGVLSQINRVLSENGINISGQYLQTNDKVGYVVIDVDKAYGPQALEALKKVEHTLKIRALYSSHNS